MSAPPRGQGRHRSALGLLARQVRYQNLLLLRNPGGPFFTFVIPLMLLVTLDLVYGDQPLPTRGGMRSPQFYLPSMAAFAVVNACYVNVISGTSLARENGVLKRMRGTPLPAWIYLAGRIGSAAVVGAGSAAAVLVAGTALFAADMVWPTLPGTIVLLVAGLVGFGVVGLAVSTLVPSADAALPVAYGTFLPVAFVSDVFFPSETGPEWLQRLAGALPLRSLARALEANLTPGAAGPGLRGRDLVPLGGWVVASAAFVAWRFRWDPARPGQRRLPGRRRRHSTP